MRPIAWLLSGMTLVLWSTPLWAQTPEPPPPGIEPGWMDVVALLINGVGVALTVKLLTSVVGWVRERAPYLIPVLSLAVLGPGMAWVQSQVAGLLGIPIDLSPWLGVFSGGAAIAGHQVYAQQARVRETGATLVSNTKL